MINGLPPLSLLLAAPPEPPKEPGMGIEFFVTVAIMIIGFMWLIQRPQAKEREERLKALEGMKKGDKVLCAGGIHGVVARINKERNTVHVEIAKGVEIEVTKSAVVVQPPPAEEKEKDKGKDKK
jgi:preprotein translocase subunit YajC